jgi:hypothetical protein
MNLAGRSNTDPLAPLGWIRTALLQGSRNLAASNAFAYATILLLQLKRVWGAWEFRDLTLGDTSSYFRQAYAWAHVLSVNLFLSPLYTAYYGTVSKAVPDVYSATMLHRYIVVFGLAAMILAMMRRLLPPGIAWLLAAWWVVLPIDFDSLYEVHLFALVLPLAAVLVVLYARGIWSRGVAFAILLADALLVRNEILLPACLWLLAIVLWEVRALRAHQGQPVRMYLLGYGLPALLSLAAFGFFYSRALVLYAPSIENLKSKEAISLCQSYAYGYQQRHSGWTGSPWTQCRDLMARVFGIPFPAPMEALRANPRALLGHVLWSIRLLPAGIQVALFNATSDRYNPDYIQIPLGRQEVLIPSFLSLGLLIAGGGQLLRNRGYWWSSWIQDRVWGWIMLFCLASVLAVVLPMQRPRSSYIFLPMLLLRAVVGMCAFVLANRVKTYRHFGQVAPVIMIAMVFLVPSYFVKGNRPMQTIYTRLAPSADYLGIKGTSLVTPSAAYSIPLCDYFTRGSLGSCDGYDYHVIKNLGDGETVSHFLARQPVPVVVFYLDRDFLTLYGRMPAVQSFIANPEPEGWKLVSLQDSPGNVWRVYANVSRLGLPSP